MVLSQCYFPDGTAVNASSNPPMVPCNPSAAASACCSTGDACSADGLCISSDFFFYRGACTDQSWGANACPSYCRTSAQSSVLSGFQVISICQNVFDTPGNSKTFTCSPAVSNCASANFTRDGVNNPILYGNITGDVATTSISPNSSTATSVTSSATVTVTASPSTSTKNSPGLVGAAVAVPIALAVILSLVLFWGMREYRRRVRAERLLGNWGHGNGSGSGNGVRSTDIMMPLREHYAPETKTSLPVQEIGIEEPRVELSAGEHGVR